MGARTTIWLLAAVMIFTASACSALGLGGMSPEEEAAAVQSAVIDLLAVRQRPIDLAHFESQLTRTVAGQDIVAYGPYVDGPEMALTPADAQLDGDEIRSLLEAAVLATPGGEALVDDALATYDELNDGSPLARRIPNQNLQAVAAYLKVVGGLDVTAEVESGEKPYVLVFPTAESAVGIDPDEAADRANAFRPQPLTGSIRITQTEGERSRLVSFDPARRHEDPRVHMVFGIAATVECSAPTRECSALRNMMVARRYLDLVLADPSLALSQSYSIRQLNTIMMGYLNSASYGAPGPEFDPDEPLGMYIEAIENSTSRQEINVTCGDSTGLDCWDQRYASVETHREEIGAWFRTLGFDPADDDTEVGSLGAPLTELARLEPPLELGDEIASGQASYLDDVSAAVIPPEQNIAYRFIVGLLGSADLEAAAEANGIDAILLAEHIATVAGTRPLAELETLAAGAERLDQPEDRRLAGELALATVEAAYNTTFVDRADGYEITLARFEQADVAPGDTIRNGDRGLAEIRDEGGGLTRLDEDTTASVPDDVGDTLRVDLERGALWHRSPPDADEPAVLGLGEVTLETVDGILAASCRPDGVCELVVVEGSVTVTLANGETIELTALDRLLIQPDGIEVEQTQLVPADLVDSEWITENLAADEALGLPEVTLLVGVERIDFSGAYEGTRTRVTLADVDVTEDSATVPVSIVVNRTCRSNQITCEYQIDSAAFAGQIAGTVTDGGFTSSRVNDVASEGCVWREEYSFNLALGSPDANGVPQSIEGTEVSEFFYVEGTPTNGAGFCVDYGIVGYDWSLELQ